MIGDVTANGIAEVVHHIVELFHPQQVILFGSYAYGTPTRDSDVDLLVVMEAGGQPLYAAARIAAGIDRPFPLDILVMEPNDLRAGLERQSVFVTEVTTRGLTLHEA